MKLYRCPWCGEKGIRPALPPVRRRYFGEDDTKQRCCKSCGQPYLDISGHDSKFLFAFGIFLFINLLIIFILNWFLRENNEILNFPALILIICFMGTYVVHFHKPVYLRYSNLEEKAFPFEYSFKAKLRFLSLKEGGVFRRKKRFYNGAILAAEFKFDEEKINKSLNKQIAVVFDNIKYHANTATCDVAFILDEKIDKSLLKKGLRFSVISNEDINFALGTVTDTIKPLPSSANKKVITKKRKNWQNPDYFN